MNSVTAIQIIQDLRKYSDHKDNPYFTFTKEGADFFVVGASRNIVEIRDVNKNHRGYYVKLKDAKYDAYVRNRFQTFDWYSIGVGCAGGGVTWINQGEMHGVFQ